MADDFASPYSGIQYFSGLWDDGYADTCGKRDALAVLIEAVRQCGEDDQRQRREFRDALAYLDRHSGCTSRLNALRRAFDIPTAIERQAQAAAALRALVNTMARP